MAGLLVFLVAFSESLVLVGLLVPGAVLMFAAGALIGTGHLHFWPTFAWAVAGAVAGDGLSFWLGWHYQARLRNKWPFSHHRDWLQRGERFFHRHGRMSVALGRFVGPVRPIIPAVAGMLGMTPVHFGVVNVLSALLWAPAYLLPGMAFGSSLAIAGQVAGRLAMLLVGLLLILWLVFWLARRIYRAIQPRAARLAARLLAWGHRHPHLGRLTDALLDPRVSPPRALFILALLLLGAAWLALSLAIYAGPYAQLTRIDQGIAHLFSSLRTPWGDHIMVFLAQLGDIPVIGGLAMVILGLLAWQRRWREVRYWLAALGFVAADLLFLHWMGSQASVVQCVIVYGFLAVFVSPELQPRWRWLPYAWSVLLVCAIALARLYLGAIHFSDLLGNLGLGGAWVIVLGVAYHRHLDAHRAIPHLPITIVLTLVATSGWHTALSHDEALNRYALHPAIQTLQTSAWWRADWRRLPAFRIDLGGGFEQPLSVQWAGELTELRSLLLRRDWRRPPPLAVTTALRWLQPDATLASLPVLPQLHEGRHESLLLVRPLGDRRQLVLRLWPADVLLRPGDRPLWIGTVAYLAERRIGFLTLPVTGMEFDAPLGLLETDLRGVEMRRGRRRVSPPQGLGWQGEVLLVNGP